MQRNIVLTLFWVACIVAIYTPLQSKAQAFTEMRDPLRGVTLYSAQISTDPLTSLQAEGSLFSSTDHMTVGVSAFFFDESDSIDEYVLWLRHDGPRRWFVGPKPNPLALYLHNGKIALEPAHKLRTDDTPEIGPLIEKMEFILTPAQFESILKSDSISLELTTALGLVEKEFTQQQRAATVRFNDVVLRRHAELMDGTG